MKLGIRSWSFRKYLPDGGMQVESFLEAAASIGFEGVELLGRHFRDVSSRSIRRATMVGQSLGVPVIAFALENDYAIADEQKRAAEVAYSKAWIRRAHEAGVPFLKVFTGDPDERVPVETQREWVRSILAELAEYAAAYGITVVVENHSEICFTHDELLRLVRDVNHEHLRVCPDVYNFDKYVGGPVVFTAARQLLPLSPYGHLQFYEIDDDGREIHMDMEKLMGIYQEMKFDGYVMFEWEGGGEPNAAMSKALKRTRALLGLGKGAK
jgi:L-ribulose-5-phosphate 3-epimerase